jgi:signal transduction histidine kinase
MALESQREVVHRSSASAESFQRWVNAVGLAIALSISYFLAARLSLALLTKPDGVAVFWPAAGVATGVLIGLGSVARVPVIAGTMAATIVANLLGDRTILSAIVFAVCNAGEAVLVAGLIERYFGSSFNLDGPRQVVGLLAATTVGTAVSGIGGTVGFIVFHGSTASILTIWHHWFTSDALGIITVAPLLIGLLSAVRDPPPYSEVVEGGVALVALIIVSSLIIFLPRQPWAVVAPIAVLFPLLLWVAARCRPVFAAAAAFIVALTIVWTTTFGIGFFGDPDIPIYERILSAQGAILTVSLCALILAALFAERRANVARLERERDNKLTNLQAVTASMAHEVRQPLAAIVANCSAALRFLGHTPPDLEEVRLALNRIASDSNRTSQIFDDIRALFTRTDRGREPVDVNVTALEVLRLLRGELKNHGVTASVELASDLPAVMGHEGQLQEVIINLFQNAIEAMAAIKDGRRTLQVRTDRHGDHAIVVEVEDSGPGIDPEKLNSIFEAFITTKPHGIGLGLAVCRMIIENHGGQLSALSGATNGALFKFVLPIEARKHHNG